MALLLYMLTIFSGAFLLFQVQPLIAKYILPWFGGGPGVWTTCLLFFQVLLLGGYAYAHVISRWLKPRAQVLVHVALLLVALALLPITPKESWKPVNPGEPVLHILALLAASIGLPYFVLSSTGPLMQRWFSQTHPGASPYRLYALSNVGSLLALLSYPFYFETHFTRKAQAGLWGGGLVIYVICAALCAWQLWRLVEGSPSPRPRSGWFFTEASPAAPGEGETFGRVGQNTSGLSGGAGTAPALTTRLLWLLLPACASVLLLAVTNKLCRDMLVMPFLWVLPLALYLLSFIICFDNPRWYARPAYAIALVLALAAACWAIWKGEDWSVPQIIGAYSAVLLVCCLVCHGELYRLRPGPNHLTEFYLMIAAGGAMGGVFVAVVAPLIFADYFELQAGLLACAVLFAVVCWLDRSRERRVGATGLQLFVNDANNWRALAAGLPWVLAVALWLVRERPEATVVDTSRNFYGRLSVLEGPFDAPKGHLRVLMHERIMHGWQFLEPPQSAWPTLYFAEESGIGRTMQALPAGHRRIGVIGLGAGTLAAYLQPGDSIRFYEINPEVERVARARFSFLGNCRGQAEVVLGDARLSMEKEAPQQYDLFVLDAFNGDNIPVHLLTREAFELYQRHLKPGGVIAVHISNLFLDLEPVLFNAAQEFNYQAVTVDCATPPEKRWLKSSRWTVLTRNADFLNSPVIRSASRPTRAKPGLPLWTDDFASLFQIWK